MLVDADPAAQLRHMPDVEAPTVVEYVPGMQLVHCAAAVA